jgi:ABC-type uncharacterized transport system auxiliary subunit
VRASAGIAAAAALAATLAGCARDAPPATFAVPRAAAAEIRMACPPGTFIGTMTVNCPRPLPRNAPVQ